MLRDLCWHGEKWARRNANSIGIVSVIVALSGIVVLLLASPTLVTAAFATANPTPQVNPIRSGEPQKFADATRDSAEEVWTILAAYAGGVPYTADFPRIIVANKALDTDCVLIDSDTPKWFDPSTDLVDACMNGKLVYISQASMVGYAQRLGIGSLLAYIVEQLASFKATANAGHFTACFTGAWVGYLHYWGLVNMQLANEVQAYFGPDRQDSFLSGRTNRSLSPCFA